MVNGGVYWKGVKESEKVVGVSKTCEREFNSVIEETRERGKEEKKKLRII